MASHIPRPRWQLLDGRINPTLWVAVGIAIIWSDYAGGLRHFPVLYTVPVMLAAWYSGRTPAVAMAATVALIRLAFISLGMDVSEPGVTLIVETLARGVVVLCLGVWIARLAELERAFERRVRILEGLLPICAFCKKIRNNAGDWEKLEGYITRRSEAQFSHGICPGCCEQHYAQDVADVPYRSAV